MSFSASRVVLVLHSEAGKVFFEISPHNPVCQISSTLWPALKVLSFVRRAPGSMLSERQMWE